MEKKCTNVGGQAVIEGVMMKSPDYIATAVRKPDGEIVYRRKKIENKKKVLNKIPFIRGVFVLIDALFLGTRELIFSSNEAGEEEENLSDFQIGLTLFTSFGIGIALFMLLPSFVGGILAKGNTAIANLIEAVLRLTLFFLYIWGISFSKEIRRVFEYHGAEHKSIYSYEKGEELTVENAKKYTTLHPRCGTSFLLIVMFFSIIVFSVVDQFIPKPNGAVLQHLARMLTRIVFLPFVAGLSYEYQRITGKYIKNPLIKLIALPGLELQKITTKEPDEKELEVALVALKAALGKENIENAREIEYKK